MAGRLPPRPHAPKLTCRVVSSYVSFTLRNAQNLNKMCVQNVRVWTEEETEIFLCITTGENVTVIFYENYVIS